MINPIRHIVIPLSVELPLLRLQLSINNSLPQYPDIVQIDSVERVIRNELIFKFEKY